LDEDGIEPEGISVSPTLSADGSVIAYVTDDPNLLDTVPGRTQPGETLVIARVDLVPRPIPEIGGAPPGAASIDDTSFALRNTIDRPGDQDWFRVALSAGTTYVIDLEGRPSRQGTLDDPLLRILVPKIPGADLDLEALDDDCGQGLNARLAFQPGFGQLTEEVEDGPARQCARSRLFAWRYAHAEGPAAVRGFRRRQRGPALRRRERRTMATDCRQHGLASHDRRGKRPRRVIVAQALIGAHHMDIRIEGVTHRYDGLLVLDGIDLAIREGETVVLVGPSGCGKSTLLGIVGGLLKPSAGRVVTAGETRADSLNPFTYVFQDFALLPWRTVQANVSLALEHHPLSARQRQERVGEALALTGLSAFAQALPKQLSGGMRQRVGIARALVVRPAVLLLDEPLSALDAQTRELLMEDMLSIWARERGTRLYVTHNLDEAARLADRVVVLSRRPGRIREILDIDVPVAARSTAIVADMRERLWRLIRDEAREAEREVQHV
jgi:NitT/TauT family transport system ATP-binding protein